MVGFRPIASAQNPGKNKVFKQSTQNMKYAIPAIIATVAALSIGCNKEKAAIEENKDARQDMIEERKDQVDSDAEIAKANVEADKVKMQAQLDAEKKKAEADAEAAKAKVDAVE